MLGWTGRRAKEEFPTGDLRHVVDAATAYAEELLKQYCDYPGFQALDVFVSAVRPRRERVCSVHLAAYQVRWLDDATAEVLDEAVLLLRKPDSHQPWELVTPAESARDQLRMTLERWVTQAPSN